MKTLRLPCLLALFVVALVCCQQQPGQQQVAGSQQAQQPGQQQASGNQNTATQTKEEEGEISLRRNIIFLFDGSGSMKDPCSDDSPMRIAIAKQAVEEFLKKVPEEDNIGLIAFSSRFDGVAVPLGTNNREKFLNAVKSFEPGGDTPLGQYLVYCAKLLKAQQKKQLDYGEFRIVVVTDGDATDDVEKGAKYAIDQGFAIHTIGLCLASTHALAKYSLSYKDANNAEELQRGLEETLSESEYFDPTEFNQQ